MTEHRPRCVKPWVQYLPKNREEGGREPRKKGRGREEKERVTG